MVAVIGAPRAAASPAAAKRRQTVESMRGPGALPLRFPLCVPPLQAVASLVLCVPAARFQGVRSSPRPVFCRWPSATSLLVVRAFSKGLSHCPLRLQRPPIRSPLSYASSSASSQQVLLLQRPPLPPQPAASCPQGRPSAVGILRPPDPSPRGAPHSSLVAPHNRWRWGSPRCIPRWVVAKRKKHT